MNERSVDFLARRIAPAAFDPSLPDRVAKSWQEEARKKAIEILEELKVLNNEG